MALKPTSSDTTAAIDDRSALDPEGILCLDPGRSLFWSAQHQCHLLVDGDDAFQLNPLAAEILAFCDGQRGLDELLQVLLPQPDPHLEQDIRAFISLAVRQQWLTARPHPDAWSAPRSTRASR